MEILSAKELKFSYPDEAHYTLNNINFSVENGEFIVMCGPSGSGKSTLLQLIKHDIAPHGETKGRIEYKNQDIKISRHF